MSTFNLGLPTDIPWERICFTDDMVHAPICGTAPPEAWRPSIAVFRYEPAIEYQTLAKHTIAYIKVTVSLTPDVPLPDNNAGQVSTDRRNPTMEKWAKKVSPCYGALLHVSVGPKGGGSAKDIYFADVEPKKREVYEAVTDTGEVASGSGTRLSIGKSAMISDSTESFAGGNAGITLNIPFAGELSLSGQKSSTNTSASQRTDLTSTDRSTERRELHSHTTQLAQLYNLLQAFHVGTNRAVFFMEPRPHILQTEATFINGPRALEGIQEVFLVVVRPEDTDFCVNVQLETAHLNITTSGIDANGEHVIAIDHTAKIPADHDRIDSGNDTFEIIYTAEAGWIIDVEKTRAEKFEMIEDTNPKIFGKNSINITSVTQSQVKVTGTVGWTATAGTLSEGKLKCNLLVHLKPSVNALNDQIDQMYLKVRKLCCCADESIETEGGGGGTIPGTNPPCPPLWLDEFIIGNDPRFKWSKDDVEKFIKRHLTGGPPVPALLQEGAQLATIMRNEMLKSLSESDANGPCAMPFQLSDIFFNRVVDGLQNEPEGTALHIPIESSSLLPASIRDALLNAVGNVSLGAVLTTNSWTLTERLGKSLQETVHIKDQILRAITTERPAASTAPLRTVTGVRIGTTYPDPNNPRILLEMADPMALQIVDGTAQPNFVDITFSKAPDVGTVTTSSITVSTNGSSIGTDIQMLSANTIRVYLTNTLIAGQHYIITAKGTGSSSVMFDGVRLDGEPLALPSGDGIAGGDFTFVMKVQAPPPTGIPIPEALLKVMGVSIASTVPNPSVPRQLAALGHPADIVEALASDQPNLITIEFNEQPDVGTVTTSSFYVTQNGSPVSASVSVSTNKTATLNILDPIVANGLYRVILSGTQITYQGRKLDGEPYRFPSGDNFGGGDFTFMMKARQPVAPPAPSVPVARLRVLGVRLMSTTPSPSAPKLLTEMIHPGTMQIVNAGDAPDVVEIDFSDEPDSGTVTDVSFTVGQGSAVLSSVVTMVNARTARLVLASPLQANQVYTVSMLGTGSSPVTLNLEPLDGDPIMLPSGDGEAGGDFSFSVAVMPAPVEISTLPLIRVKSLRVLSNYLDPQNYEFVTSSFHPSETMQAYEADKPNAIDIEFTAVPDVGTVTATSFTIASSAGTVAHTVAMLNSTTARMTITDPLVAGTTYTITVSGDAPDAVTYQTRALDGDAFGYPSGDGVEGGDFEVKLKVLA